MKTISENARGYVCLDCNNSNLFEGMSDLYRLYKLSNHGSTYYDFDNEIVCPYEMKCYECNSRNIGIEVEPGNIIKNNKITDHHGMWHVGQRWLLDVEDSDDNNEFECLNQDGDSCDDCALGFYNPENDGCTF